ncbi:hypothetical protein BDW62DRAFT_199150 [Aspergillus aurantiobrunneus]
MRGARYPAVLFGLFTVSASLSGALAAVAGKAKYRRDETPNFPSDPDTTSYCTWWWDNDGSIPCSDMPAVWGITLEDFLRWVRFSSLLCSHLFFSPTFSNNPSITPSCGNFPAEHSYCVEAFGEPEPEPTSTTATTTTTAGPPGETQPGQIETCYPGVTLEDFIAWNSEIGAQCQYLWVGYYICTGISGFTPTVTTTTTTATPTNGVTTPTPTQPGMVSNCDAFHLVESGDRCEAIASDNGITQAQFLDLDEGVGAGCSSLWLGYYVRVSTLDVEPTTTIATTTSTPTNGVATPTPTRPGMEYGVSLSQLVSYNPEVKADCSGLWLGYYVCVSIIGVEPTTTTTTTSTSTNGISTPTPIRPGMISNCDAFYNVQSGDGRAVIARNHGISVNQLYAWRTQIGTGCSGLWAGYYICVSVIGVNPTSTTTSTGNAIATPTPTQAGMVGNCRVFHLVVSGDNCESIAQDAGVTLARFYSWNSGVGSSCGSLWLGYYVCIGV